MGRKKKKPSKPWCWYCNREFDDEKILIQHQKAKHFKCHICHKKLYTGPGLAIHCMQVHKETIEKIPNALPNRGNVDIEIYGMEGIPEADLRMHEKNKGTEAPYTEPAKPSIASTSTIKPAPVAPPGMMSFPGYMSNPTVAPYMSGVMPVPGMPPFALAPNAQFPGVPPPLSGLPFPPGSIPTPTPPPPPAISSAVTTSGSISATPALVPSTATPTAPVPATAPKPLFPSAANNSSLPVQVSAPPASPATIVTTTATTRIIHPEEDLSLEELRTRLPRYKHLNLETMPTPVPQPINGNNPVSAAPVAAAPALYGAVQPPPVVPSPLLSAPVYPPAPPFLPPPPLAAQYQPTFRPAY